MTDTTAAAVPPAPYLGGKRNLARRLCAMIERIPHRSYVEPCVGMGGVFLRRRTPAAAEIINDASGDVANLFRVIRHHHGALIDQFRWMPAGRDEFERQKRLDPTALTDIQRAARFLYLQRLAFGGRVDGRTFGVRRDQSSRICATSLGANLAALARRLERVTIEQLDIVDAIRRYDGPRALFYIDPPYDATSGYGLAFPRERYVELAGVLATIRGQFLLSINATPFIRETFAGFAAADVPTTWTVAHRGAEAVTELVIAGGADAVAVLSG